MPEITESGYYDLYQLRETASGRTASRSATVTDLKIEKIERKMASERRFITVLAIVALVSGIVLMISWTSLSDMREYDEDYFPQSEWTIAIAITVVSSLSLVFCVLIITLGRLNPGRELQLHDLRQKKRHYWSASSTALKEKERAAMAHIESLALDSGVTLHNCKIPKTNDRCAYCKKFVAFGDSMFSKVIYIKSEDITEIRLETREASRSSTTNLSSGRGNAAGGAALGALLFGAEGMDAGAVVGAAGERQSVSEERVRYSHIVTVFTKVENYPYVAVDFGSDDKTANHFYGVTSSGSLQ